MVWSFRSATTPDEGLKMVTHYGEVISKFWDVRQLQDSYFPLALNKQRYERGYGSTMSAWIFERNSGRCLPWRRVYCAWLVLLGLLLGVAEYRCNIRVIAMRVESSNKRGLRCVLIRIKNKGDRANRENKGVRIRGLLVGMVNDARRRVKDYPQGKQKQSMPADFARLPPTTGRVYATTRDQAARIQSVKIISAMKARTLISHGCQGFLASVMDTSLESPNIENLSVTFKEAVTEMLGNGIIRTQCFALGCTVLSVQRRIRRHALCGIEYSDSNFAMLELCVRGSWWLLGDMRIEATHAIVQSQIKGKTIGMCSNDQALRDEGYDGSSSFPFTIHPGQYLNISWLSGLLQPLEILCGIGWNSIDFVTCVLLTQKRRDADLGWLFDRLTKKSLVLHGYLQLLLCPTEIQKFMYRFERISEKLGELVLSSVQTFHPQTDGQSERTIQTLEDMLRACALEWTGSWDEYLCLVEFAYNNSWHASIKTAPFETFVW
ncbi:putative nucleotidyltransferase, ribonuclease H [Tanacetum coccineum]